MASRRQLVEEGLQVFSKNDGPSADFARGQLTLTDQLENLGPANASGLAHVLDCEANFVVHRAYPFPDAAGSAARRFGALG